MALLIDLTGKNLFLCQSRKKLQKVHNIYDKLLLEDIDPTLVSLCFWIRLTH